LAEAKEKKTLTDEDAHAVISSAGFLPDEFEDYEIPSVDSFSRYLRTARSALGEQKYSPRRGRNTGKSVVSEHDV
ncbi:MAG: hypothetical protein KDB27_12065, partial [Planctomycetales bacterium]|nr:hypothetical protein [Planctomycetales bacterium]